MRILFLNYEYPPLGGGAGNASEFLLREFAKDSTLEVDAVVSAADNVAQKESLGGGVSVYRLPIGDKRQSLKNQSAKDLLLYTWKALRMCKKLMREQKYDGVHAFFTVPCGAVAWRLHARFGIPFLVSLRGSDVPGYSRKYERLYFFIRPLVRKIWERAALIVSNSRGLKDLALKTDPRQIIDVIYNGVDTEAFSPHIDRTDKEFRILCASRLERRKGFCYVVEAVDILKERYPNIRLILAGGDGNAGEELRALVAEKKLDSFVTFSGQYDRAKLAELQSMSDVFILPSFNEGMSNSLLEAMAGELPVLMTPTGGAEELIIEGKNGYTIQFADKDDIAQKVELLMQNGEKTRLMGKESRRMAQSMQWSCVAEKYRTRYAEKFDSKTGQSTEL